MSVAMTNCGEAGWVSDRAGYRYDAEDPDSGRRWPAMPAVFADLAGRAAARAGFAGVAAAAFLINRYGPGSRLSLHQDRNERDFTAPIVSVSLGLPAVFLFGGARRADRPLRVPLEHGDIVVWDSLAIIEFLADRHGSALYWPEDEGARAVARSMSAEMHSGFANLRREMPMNVRKSFPAGKLSDEVREEIDRILQLWAQARARFGGTGDFLFGGAVASWLDAIPGSKRIPIPNAGHFSHIEQPAEFGTAVGVLASELH